MNTLSMRHTSPLDVLSVNLSDVISLPDPEAAEELSHRMSLWVRVEELRERSYIERGIIAREVERRSLWRHLDDPETGFPFTSFSAWMGCRDYLGCRRTNFAAKADVKLLESDVPLGHLVQITDKGNIKTLIEMSSADRKDPAVLAAAKTLDNEQFLAKVEKERPNQHLSVRRMHRSSLGRNESDDVEQAIEWAIEHEIAGSPSEALHRMAVTALEKWKEEGEQ